MTWSLFSISSGASEWGRPVLSGGDQNRRVWEPVLDATFLSSYPVIMGHSQLIQVDFMLESEKTRDAKWAVTPVCISNKHSCPPNTLLTPHPTSSWGCMAPYKENTVFSSITTASGNSNVQYLDELIVLYRVIYTESFLCLPWQVALVALSITCRILNMLSQGNQGWGPGEEKERGLVRV